MSKFENCTLLRTKIWNLPLRLEKWKFLKFLGIHPKYGQYDMSNILEKLDLTKVLKIVIYDTVNLFYDGFGTAYTFSILHLHTYGRFVFSFSWVFSCDHIIFRLGILRCSLLFAHFFIHDWFWWFCPKKWSTYSFGSVAFILPYNNKARFRKISKF